jgi:hypothetical protein
MTKTKYIEFALDCGIRTARALALCAGVTAAQCDIWEAGIPAYRAAHHYGSGVAL